MDNLFKILIILFASLAVMVFVLERIGKPMDDEQQSKISKWFLPLMAILALASIFRYFMD